jgi:hypothetical protein
VKHWISGLLLLALPHGITVEPSPVALKIVERLPAARMGVDRDGNLWAWDPKAESIAVLAPQGSRLEPWKAPGAQAVDLDPEWGLVGLYKYGSEIHWSRRGMPDIVLLLPNQSTDLCWIGPATVAVTPRTNEHRVEIWNLKDQVLAQSFGQEQVVGHEPGAVRLRAVLLLFDRPRERLYTLESESGDLQVYDRAGKLLWRAAFPDPGQHQIDSWLRDLDSQAKKQGTANRPLLFRLYPAIDGDGTFWTAREIHTLTKTAVLASSTVLGTSQRVLTKLSCTSFNLVFWGNQIVFYTDPAMPRDVCNGVRRIS